MKKFIALLLSIISALFVLTSCSPTLLILDGKYYQRDKGIGSNYINETCVYDVSVAYQTPYQTTDYTNLNQTAKFVIDEGTLTTNLTNFDSDAQVKYGTTGYVYTSTLVVKGKYVINGVEQKIENEVTSKTYFKDFIYNFEPCYSEKQVKNSTLLNINNEYKVAYYEYGYTVNYGDKASTEITVTNDEFNHLTGLQGTFDFANYNEGAYVDNEILLFVPRTFNLSNDYSQSFKTV
ncbi:MAG: hypothetical protein J6R88_00275, partial [Clostridia bacterium]|nr:hypothetical protein [Clostridia bacterium]